MRSLATIGYEMKKSKSDNNNKNTIPNKNKNNVGGPWGPVPKMLSVYITL